ncbi:hypothetical protein AB0878_44885 [Amycolatopsis sp. NPDC047767]|uniref:hypothetical protein n=1 Tax=Amycolatopsis sp. NPDC047767 TaxID=3156765 RepID=UPI003456966F
MPITALEPMLCSHCDSPTTMDDLVSRSDGDEICPACATSRFYLCYCCDLYAGTLFRTDAGSDICGMCQYDHGYHECRYCSTLVTDEDCCQHCSDPDTLDADLVHDYDYKPRPVFHGEGSLHFGVELEVNTPSDRLTKCAELCLRDLGNLGYLKEDSSIFEGFEIVTHPMSFPWAMANFPWVMLGRLKSEGCNGEGTGLHIHVSRDGFANSSHVYRWMKFIYRNSREVQRLARRRNSDYAEFGPYVRQTVKEACKGGRPGPRYAAVNTLNSATFELRMFASSLEPDQVQAALTFAAATIEYTRELSIPAIVHCRGWEWETFTNWVSLRPEYSTLTQEWEALTCAC